MIATYSASCQGGACPGPRELLQLAHPDHPIFKGDVPYLPRFDDADWVEWSEDVRRASNPIADAVVPMAGNTALETTLHELGQLLHGQLSALSLKEVRCPTPPQCSMCSEKGGAAKHHRAKGIPSFLQEASGSILQRVASLSSTSVKIMSGTTLEHNQMLELLRRLDDRQSMLLRQQELIASSLQ